MEKLIKIAEIFEKLVKNEISLTSASDDVGFIIKNSYIKTEMHNGTKYYVVRSPSNPKWNGGKFRSRKAAVERLKEVERIKHIKQKEKD